MATPVQLIDQISDISQAYTTLKQRLDKKSAEALGKKILALRDLLRKGLEDLEIWKNDSDLDSTKLARWDMDTTQWKLDHLKKLDDRITLEESTELATFFHNISNSVVDAQKELNESSKQYIKELEDSNSPVPPTYYSIPSLKAEMKLGISEMTSRGVNVILFKSEQQKDRFFESTVSFELVSSPPAPATRKVPPPPPAPENEIASFHVLDAFSPNDTESLQFEPVAETDQKIEHLMGSLERAEATLLTASDRISEALAPKKATTQRGAKKTTTKRAVAKKSAKKTATRKRAAKKKA
ncbi:MAG TPA: hypothetical protein VI306_16260 [Pyrinomonadaceae bacterium]